MNDELEKRVKALELMVASLTRRMDLREASKPSGQVGEFDEPRKPKADAQGNVPRGKYEGRAHSWVVQNDPWHVQWLHSEGKADGLGYTEEQIQDAIDDPRPKPRRY